MRHDVPRADARLARVEIAVLVAVLGFAIGSRLGPLHGAATDYDEGVYWQSLMAMGRGQALYSQIFSSQPPLFLGSIYPLYLLFGKGIAAARLSVGLYSIAGIVALYLSVRSLAGRLGGVVAAVLLATDSAYLFQSHSLQAEVPSVAVGTVAVALAITAMSRSGRSHLALAGLAGAAAGAATMIKLSGIAALIPVLFFLAGSGRTTVVGREEGSGARPIRRGAVAGFAAATGFMVMVALVVLTQASHLSQMWDQAVRMHVLARSALPAGILPTLGFLLNQPGQVPLALLASFSLVLAAWRRSAIVVGPLAWFVATLGALMMVRPVFDHMQVLLIPPLAMLAALAPSLAAGGGGAVGVARPRIRLTVACSIGLACVVVMFGVVRSVSQDREAADPLATSELAMVSALRSHTSASLPVVTDNQYLAAVAGRYVPPELVDTSFVRVATGNLTAGYVGSIISREHPDGILFATGRLDVVPGLRSWVSSRFDEGVSFPDGSQLFLPYR